MKTKKWLLSLWTICAVLCFASCQEWGDMDPIPGTDVNPRLEQVISFTFEDDAEINPEIIQYLAYDGGSRPVIVSDAELESKVLHMDGGYVRIENPLNDVKVQNGVSLTFMMKQVSRTDEEGEPVTQDLEGALFSFQDEEGVNKMFFTANCWINYAGTTGTYEDNNPNTDYKTGHISDGEWHYVAISIRKDGYAVYVDGYKKIDKVVSGVVFPGIFEFMATAPYIYIGAGSDTETSEWMIDDFTIYRNQITNKEIEDPRAPSTGDDDDIPYIPVGSEDYTSGYQTTYSDLIKISGNGTIHFGFYNYNSGSGGNWNNWYVTLSNGKAADESGFVRYLEIRADSWSQAYGDGTENNGDYFSSDYNWDTFVSDMNGAYVDLTIKRTGNNLSLTAVTTTKAGTVYTMTYNYDYTGSLSDEFGAFMGVDNSYMEINPYESYAEIQAYNAGSYIVGPTDFSAGWWSYFSNFTKLSGNTNFGYTLYNYTNEVNVWNNFVLIVTNGKDRGEDGYLEYFALRADGAGWGNDATNAWDDANLSFDPNTNISLLNGAYCQVFVSRSGSRVDVRIRITPANGQKLADLTYYSNAITTSDLGLFLVVEGSYLDIRSEGYYPFLNQ